MERAGTAGAGCVAAPAGAANGALTAGAIGEAGWRALRLALSSAVGTMIHNHA
jgi:hypothetical protein